MILDYENYDETREDFLRRRHTSSPLGSTGSGGESSLSSFQGDQDSIQSPVNNVISDEDSGKFTNNSIEIARLISTISSQMMTTKSLVTVRSPMLDAP